MPPSNQPKILIENQNALGHNVEQVTLDTNRVDLVDESTWRLGNVIALSSRGLWVDVSSWIVYCAAAVSLAELALSMGAPMWSIDLLLGLPLITLSVIIGCIMQRRSHLVPYGMFRFFLLIIGVVIAIV